MPGEQNLIHASLLLPADHFKQPVVDQECSGY